MASLRCAEARLSVLGKRVTPGFSVALLAALWTAGAGHLLAAQEPPDPPADAAAPAGGPAGGTSGALQRVPPVPIQREEAVGPGTELQVMRANAIEWRRLLASEDLDERERSYEEILRRARVDPLARSFFERLAREPERLELAWTGRLALRELGPTPTVRFRGIEGDLFSLDAGIGRMLSEILGASPEAGFSLPPRNRLRIQAMAPETRSGKSVAVQNGPAGTRIVVTDHAEVAGGRTGERIFEGESLEQILEANPELAQELDLSMESLSQAFRMRVDVQQEEGGSRVLLTPFAYGDRRREARDPQGWFRDMEGLFSPRRRSALVRTDVLGVRSRAIPAEVAKQWGVATGLEVLLTEPGTIAERLGVVRGDILLALDGMRLARPEQITARFAERAPGERLVLSWIDDLGQRQVGTWEPEAAPTQKDG